MPNLKSEICDKRKFFSFPLHHDKLYMLQVRWWRLRKCDRAAPKTGLKPHLPPWPAVPLWAYGKRVKKKENMYLEILLQMGPLVYKQNSGPVVGTRVLLAADAQSGLTVFWGESERLKSIKEGRKEGMYQVNHGISSGHPRKLSIRRDL